MFKVSTSTYFIVFSTDLYCIFMVVLYYTVYLFTKEVDFGFSFFFVTPKPKTVHNKDKVKSFY